MMRTVARPGQAVAQSSEVDWRAPVPRPRRRAVPAARCIPFKVRDSERGQTVPESFTKSAWHAIRSDEMAEIGLPRP